MALEHFSKPWDLAKGKLRHGAIVCPESCKTPQVVSVSHVLVLLVAAPRSSENGGLCPSLVLVPSWKKAELGALLQAEEGDVCSSFHSGKVVQHLAALLRAESILGWMWVARGVLAHGGMGDGPGDTAVNVCVERN